MPESPHFVFGSSSQYSMQVQSSISSRSSRDSVSSSALGGRPPISRTSGSDYRIVFELPPVPLDTAPRQLAFEDLVEPTS